MEDRAHFRKTVIIAFAAGFARSGQPTENRSRGYYWTMGRRKSNGNDTRRREEQGNKTYKITEEVK